MASANRMRSLAGRLQWRRLERFKLHAKPATPKNIEKLIGYRYRARLSQACCAREICGLLIPCAPHKSYAAAQAKGRASAKIRLNARNIRSISLDFSNTPTRHATCFSPTSTKTAACRIVAASGGCIPEAQLLRGPPRLSPRDAIPKASKPSIALVRGRAVRTANDVQLRSRACRSHLRSKRNH